MEILLEEFYHIDLHIESYKERKIFLDTDSCQLIGVSKSGKTTLIKKYLLELKKNTYLYIDCKDIRIDIQALNTILNSFCNKNKIEVIALDNYISEMKIPTTKQVILSGEIALDLENTQLLELYPLDYEEFLAYEHKYDSSALNHFFQLGGFASMHHISSDNRSVYIQEMLRNRLDDIEFDILCLCAKFMSQKVSAYTLYERLKQHRKISKDKLYKSFESLECKKYIHTLSKLHHLRATKKIYLCDSSLKSALSTEKNFARLFENMVYLELLKAKKELYYDDGIDFYLPDVNEIILCKPFMDERQLFKKLESIEEFLFTHSIAKITVVSMSKEGSVAHPLAKVEILPFDIWALGD